MAFSSKQNSVELSVSSVLNCLSSLALFVIFSPLNKQFGKRETVFLDNGKNLFPVQTFTAASKYSVDELLVNL